MNQKRCGELNSELLKAFKQIKHALDPNVPTDGSQLLFRYRQTLRVQNHRQSWHDWVLKGEQRDGYSIVERFKGWASSNPFPSVVFCTIQNNKIRKGYYAVIESVTSDGIASCIVSDGNVSYRDQYNITGLIPIFVGKLGGSATLGKKISDHVGSIKALRNEIDKERKSAPETRDDLEESVAYSVDPYTGQRHSKLKTFDGKIIRKATLTNSTILADKGNDNMKTPNTKTERFVETQKKALEQVAYLNAGRVSNKVVKEAMRPIVALLFKPTFVQKLAMKLTGAKNPLDDFMDTPFADLLCAELFKLALEMREVDNQKVHRVANNAIVHAGLKVTEKIPVEDLIDGAISQVTDKLKDIPGFDK
ncbi:hypothetical protein VPHD3_0134 [Vibrio phage D3]